MSKTTPPLRGAPPKEGNPAPNSPPLEGWQAKPDGVVPVLRFPEFRDTEEWARKPFEEAFKRLTTKNSEDNQNALTISAQLGLVSQLEYFNKKVAAKDLSGYYLLHKGDFAYNKSYSQGYPMGAIKPLKLYDKGVVSTLYICFRARQEFNESFFEHYFEAGLLNSEIGKIAQEGGRAHGLLNVSVSEFFTDVNLHVPQPEEQQKIADCLISIDELIAVQTQKLDALKTHKKGLMQQLFPAEGETVPKLRFPEFRDKGVWRVIELDQLGELVSGLTYNPDDVRDQGLLVLRSSNVQNGMIALEDNVFVRSDIKGVNLSKPNDILICVRNGSKSLIGKNALIPDGIPSCTHGAFMTVFRSKSAKFIFQLFQTAAYERQVSADLGATINSINGNQFKKYKFHVPEGGEQEKIADCLASLDELIIAQAQKIEALKTHKNGLMQQLFPSVGGGGRRSLTGWLNDTKLPKSNHPVALRHPSTGGE